MISMISPDPADSSPADALDLAVIIVTWNTRALVLDALRTLLADLEHSLDHSQIQSAVWVVDNQSSDGTPTAVREQFPQVNVIDAGANLGFAAGNNRALRAMGFHDQPTPNPNGPRAILLLNPDTLTTPGAIKTLMEALFKLPRAGVVGAQLVYEDGAFQHGAFQFPSLLQILIDLYPLPARLHGRLYESRWNGRYPRRWYAAGTPFEVDHTLGATMLLRREVVEQTGLFDEQFFMYCEEVDWSKRIRSADWAIYAVPQAQITHLEGRSAAQIKPQSVLNLWTSRLKFYHKHYAPWQLQVARWLVRGGMAHQIRNVERMTTLSSEQRAALIDAYQRVQQLFCHG